MNNGTKTDWGLKLMNIAVIVGMFQFCNLLIQKSIFLQVTNAGFFRIKIISTKIKT